MARPAVRRTLPGQSPDPRVAVSMTVNGERVGREVSPRMLLSDFIRHELGLTGTHVGCEHGVCGCCTVIIDGKAGRSCLAFAIQADGADIRTIESVAGPDGSLHPVQRAFRECHGLQCGYCTPGFVMSIVDYLEDNPDPGPVGGRHSRGPLGQPVPLHGLQEHRGRLSPQRGADARIGLKEGRP